jgi:hypothetical protein
MVVSLWAADASAVTNRFWNAAGQMLLFSFFFNSGNW